jgi:hypothetical protein
MATGNQGTGMLADMGIRVLMHTETGAVVVCTWLQTALTVARLK